MMGHGIERRAVTRRTPAPVQAAAARRAHLRTRMERERIIVRLRGLVLLFTVVQSLIKAGDSLVLTWVVATVLAVDWLVTRQLVQRDSERHHVIAGWFGMVMDTVLVALALANTRHDVADPTFLIVLFLSLEAALRWGRWGGLIGGAVAGLLASIWGWSVITDTGHGPVSHATLRFFTITIVGAITGDLVHRLNVERGRLAEMAYADPLTGLANRAAFQEAVAIELAQGASPALIYLDLDGFKSVNDGLGHTAGDAVLNAVADRMRATVREGDLVARPGR